METEPTDKMDQSIRRVKAWFQSMPSDDEFVDAMSLAILFGRNEPVQDDEIVRWIEHIRMMSITVGCASNALMGNVAVYFKEEDGEPTYKLTERGGDYVKALKSKEATR